MVANRHKARALAAAIGVMAACTQPAGDRDAIKPSARSTTIASPSGASPATKPDVRAERMRLVGNVPGSDGTLAFWGDLAVVNHWEDSGTPSPDDGFVVIDVSDPDATDAALPVPMRRQLQRHLHLGGPSGRVAERSDVG